VLTHSHLIATSSLPGLTRQSMLTFGMRSYWVYIPCAWLEDCGNLIKQNPSANLHSSGGGVAMPMAGRVAWGAMMITEQKRGG
jgi:hypothetical protein